MPPTEASKTRLRKHADYQRVYKSGRKQFSRQMSYFYALRPASQDDPRSFQGSGPRVGITAGKVLGGAVDRNRIKRRMREAIRKHVALLAAPVDVVLHPKKTVLEIEFPALEREVASIFATIQAAAAKSKKNAAAKAIAQPSPALASPPSAPAKPQP